MKKNILLLSISLWTVFPFVNSHEKPENTESTTRFIQMDPQRERKSASEHKQNINSNPLPPPDPEYSKKSPPNPFEFLFQP